MTEPSRRCPAPDDPAAAEDPFRLGSRWIRVRRPDGAWESREIPLTAMDLLDPQEGDLVVQNTWHANTVYDIFGALKWRYETHPDVLVGTDLKMLWGIRGLQNPAPDVVVIPRVRDREKLRPSFHVLKEGTRPILEARREAEARRAAEARAKSAEVEAKREAEARRAAEAEAARLWEEIERLKSLRG